MVRTYFGSEMGFVAPEWIEGFPYGFIPHPMIMGQLWAYSVMFYWWRSEMTTENCALLAAHATCYTLHMAQEHFTSSYKYKSI